MTPLRFDRGALERLVGPSPEALRELYLAYLGSCSQCVDLLQEGLDGADEAAVFSALHRMKSASLQVGALGLAELVAGLQPGLQSEHAVSLGAVSRRMADIRAELDHVRSCIESELAKLPAP